MDEKEYALYRTLRQAKMQKSAAYSGCTSREGTPKRGWETEGDAMVYLNMLQRRRKGTWDLRHYECQDCGLWHVTKQGRYSNKHFQKPKRN